MISVSNRMFSLRHNGIFLMICASLFFSLMGALVKFSTVRLPSSEAVFFRALVSLVIIAPWMASKKIPFFGESFFLLFLRGASGFTALALSFYVTSKIRLADASILNHTSVLFVALLSILWLKEKITPPLVIYILCALIGVMLIVKPHLNVGKLYGLLGLASGFFAAIAYIAIKQLHKSESFFTMVFNFSLISTGGALLFFHHQFIWPTLSEWLVLIFMGLSGTVAQLLMTYSYKFTPASMVSPYSFSSVLFSAIWGMLFWNEVPDLWSVMGALLIIACGVGILKMKKGMDGTEI